MLKHMLASVLPSTIEACRAIGTELSIYEMGKECDHQQDSNCVLLLHLELFLGRTLLVYA